MKTKALILILLIMASAAIAVPPEGTDAVEIRVTADRVNIRQTAMLSAPAVGRAEKGQVFTVIQKDGEWYLIQLPDGTPGYIHSFTVETVVEGRAAAAEKPAAAVGKQVQVTAERANIRKAAVLSAPLLLTVEKGRLLPVVQKDGEWYLIQLPDGTPGYIHSFTVAEVTAGQAVAAAKQAGIAAEAAAPPVEKTADKPLAAEKTNLDSPVPANVARAETPPPVRAPSIPKPRSGPEDSFSMFLLRAGYFIAADSAYTEVYQNGPVYGGELRIGGARVSGWLEGTYRSETGELTYTKEKTEVSVMSVSAGALYRFLAGNLNPYAGAGIGYVLFKEKNEAIGEAKQNKVGFCLVGGAAYILGKNFVLDARLKYEFCKMKPADFDIEVGGLTAGLGIGFRW